MTRDQIAPGALVTIRNLRFPIRLVTVWSPTSDDKIRFAERMSVAPGTLAIFVRAWPGVVPVHLELYLALESSPNVGLVLLILPDGRRVVTDEFCISPFELGCDEDAHP